MNMEDTWKHPKANIAIQNEPKTWRAARGAGLTVVSTFALVCEAEPTTSRHTAVTDHGLVSPPDFAPPLSAIMEGGDDVRVIEADTLPEDALPAGRREGDAPGNTKPTDADGSVASKKRAENFMTTSCCGSEQLRRGTLQRATWVLSCWPVCGVWCGLAWGGAERCLLLGSEVAFEVMTMTFESELLQWATDGIFVFRLYLRGSGGLGLDRNGGCWFVELPRA